MDIKKRLEQVIKSVVGREVALDEKASFKDDLGIDSLSMIEIVIACEGEFNIEFAQSDLSSDNLDCVGAFLKLLEKRI